MERVATPELPDCAIIWFPEQDGLPATAGWKAMFNGLKYGDFIWFRDGDDKLEIERTLRVSARQAHERLRSAS